MNNELRREVLHLFKKLHRTRLYVFKDDVAAQQVVRKKINDEYKKYKDVTNQAAIEELNRFSQEVEQELRMSVIQAIQTEPGGHYELRIRPEITIDNATVPTETCQEKPRRNRSKQKNVEIEK